MKTFPKEKVFSKFDFACIGEITMRKHVNTKKESVPSDVGECKKDKIREGAVTDIKDLYQRAVYIQIIRSSKSLGPIIEAHSVPRNFRKF